jgi:beta-lactamase superfamily II metal-dependent hydrolase
MPRDMKVHFVALLLLLSLPAVAQQPKTLPPWTRGTLDIHQISTGHGNAAFFVFPDGTTMLVDAGAVGDDTTGAKIARYITRMAPSNAELNAIITHYHADHMAGFPEKARLDYALITHFHSDHMSAIPDVGTAIPIGTLIDRGTSYLPPPDDETMKKFHAFLVEKHVKEEAIRVGANDQIVLLHEPDAFKSFEVRNVAANGQVWTGEGSATRTIFPATYAAEDKPSENMCSIGIRIRYGRFDFFTGGDMPGVPDAGAPEWQSVETAVARVIGATDVHVANHHGSIDPESAFFLATLRSPVIILPSWSPTHPSQDSLKRMLATRLYPGPHDIFATKLDDATKTSIGSRADQLKAQHGHIVVRVAPGGDRYQVFVLDELSEEANVVAVHGPYDAR